MMHVLYWQVTEFIEQIAGFDTLQVSILKHQTYLLIWEYPILCLFRDFPPRCRGKQD